VRRSEHIVRRSEHIVQGSEHIVQGSEHIAQGSERIVQRSERIVQRSEHIAQRSEHACAEAERTFEHRRNAALTRPTKMHCFSLFEHGRATLPTNVVRTLMRPKGGCVKNSDGPQPSGCFSVLSLGARRYSPTRGPFHDATCLRTRRAIWIPTSSGR